ncbi:transposase [Sinorhizobium medicae]|nr:transposase [Sinorhizobium medicae]
MSAPMSEARSLHMIEPVASRLEGTPREVRRWSDESKAQAVVEAMQPSTNISTVAHRIGSANRMTPGKPLQRRPQLCGDFDCAELSFRIDGLWRLYSCLDRTSRRGRST